MRTAQANGWRSLWRRARPVDRLTAGYILAFGLGVVVLGRGSDGWWHWALAHLLLFAAVVMVVQRWGECTSGIRGFVRLLYPAMLYPFFYRETQIAVQWVFPDFLDHQIVALERAVFGVDPNVWILPVQSAPLNDLFMLGYVSYYPLVAMLPLALYFGRRYLELSRALYAMTTAFVISYALFVLYPLEGPRYYLAGSLPGPLAGLCFVPLANWVVGQGAIHGGCMPSSHAAVALVVMVWSWRTMPRLAMAVTPLVALLCVGTVWGRFHYVSDVAVGWVVGATALWLTRGREALILPVPDRQVLTESSRAGLFVDQRS
ncbi:MAG: phosphatase PAP2 family protein [Candidatus Zixiibacteriota bacterium]